MERFDVDGGLRALPNIRRRRSRLRSFLAAAGMVASLLVGGCRSRSSPPAAIPLPMPESAGDDSHGIWLWPGESVRWTVPRGPGIRLRFRFRQPLGWPGGTTQTLVAGGDSPKSRLAARLPSSDRGSDAGWRTLSVPIAGSFRERGVSIAVEPAADPRPVLVAGPVVDWPRIDRPKPRIIVLFDVDTLRADHLSLYGYGRRTSPSLDRIFASGLVAERCFSNATWTLPSHASMFTSTLVNRHRVRTPADRLPANFPVVAEALQKAGYSTFAVTNGGYVDAEYGFSRGFDRYDSSNGSIEEEVARALEALDSAPGSRVFLFLHTFQVHNYAPTSRSASELFGDTSPLGPRWFELVRHQLETDGALPAERRGWAIHRYDAAIRRVDDAFGKLVEGLEKRGVWPDTAVVLVSDHGEALFEHPTVSPDAPDYFGHPLPHLYDAEIHVPFAVRCPWKTWKGRLARPVSLLDLAPTLLDLAGAPSPPTFEGSSLASASAPPALFSASPTYDAFAVREAGRKMIVRPDFRQESWEATGLHDRLPARECFLVDRDPGERSPVPCDAPGFADLATSADRYVASSFSRSIVLRLAGAGGAPCRVFARAAGAPPQESSFAIRPGSVARKAGATRVIRTPLGASPVWLAFRPRVLGGGLSIEIEGCGPIRDVRSRGISTTEASWAELLWKSGPLPPGNVLLSVPPLLEPLGTQANPLSTQLVRRLRALGYLSGDSNGTPAENALSDEKEPSTIPPVRPGEVGVRVR